MGWLDDTKKKAQQAAADATAKAQEEAGKAALNAMWGAMKRSVGAVAEKILGAAESELEAQQKVRAERDGPEEGERAEDPVDPEEIERIERERRERERKEREEAAAEKQRAAEAKAKAARDELARMKAERGSTRPTPEPRAPAEAPPPEEIDAPEGDPMGAAERALRAAALARGVDPDAIEEEEEPTQTPEDPMAAAQAVLDRAAAARKMAQKGSRAAAREEAALEELRKLKALREEDPKGDPEGEPPERKRSL